jgi:hypothetical protein
MFYEGLLTGVLLGALGSCVAFFVLIRWLGPVDE